MSFTKPEKRLFIREVAKGLWCGGGDFTAKEAIANAVHLADELESFERKQDEEEAVNKNCFGLFHEMEQYAKAEFCCQCDYVQKCYKEKRGAK
jgi:hypothetical protein